MSWKSIATHLYPFAKAGVAGTTATVGSCYLALHIEAASHKALFKLRPDLYANLEATEINGIDADELASVQMAARIERQLQQQQQLMAAQQLAAQQQKIQRVAAEEKETTEYSTNTIFTIESFVKPARQRVQDLSIDLSSCAMTG